MPTLDRGNETRVCVSWKSLESSHLLIFLSALSCALVKERKLDDTLSTNRLLMLDFHTHLLAHHATPRIKSYNAVWRMRVPGWPG